MIGLVMCAPGVFSDAVVMYFSVSTDTYSLFMRGYIVVVCHDTAVQQSSTFSFLSTLVCCIPPDEELNYFELLKLLLFSR